MALDFIESWDPQNSELGKWDSVTAPVYNLLIPRSGLACAEIAVGRQWSRDVRETPLGVELFVGGAWRQNALDPSVTTAVYIGEGTGAGDPRHGVFEVSSTGQIQAGKNNPNDLIGGTSPAGTIRSGVWQFVECRVLIDDAAGEYEVYVDGVQELLTVGVDSRDGGAGVAQTFRLLQIGLNGVCFFDDIYVVTPTGAAPRNTFLGDTEIVALFPDADGATIAWTPIPGPAPNFQYVDEAPPATADLVRSATPGNIDLYSHDPCPAGPIIGVQQTWYGQKDAIGVRLLRHRVESPDGGVVSESPDRSLPTGGFIVDTYLWSQNPNGPVDWTQATVDAAAFGFHLTS